MVTIAFRSSNGFAMNQTAPEISTDSIDSPAPLSIHQTEQRLEALCQLVNAELRGISIDDQALAEYSRRMIGEIDQVMTEETCWFDSVDFN